MSDQLARDLARFLDPVQIASAVGMVPDDWQTDFLRSKSGRVILNCCRQAGKTAMSAIIALHTATYEPGSLTLVLSPAQRQSQELLLTCKTYYRALGRPIAADADSALQLSLENGSRIVALPGTEQTVRGFANVKLLIVDEAARVDDELYYYVRPMLAVSGGRIMLLSTPYGRRGFFYDSWISKEAWERYEIKGSQVPRISPDFLAEEMRTSGQWVYAQEYDCQFNDNATAAFSTEDIERAFNEKVEAWSL